MIIHILMAQEIAQTIYKHIHRLNFIIAKQLLQITRYLYGANKKQLPL